MHALFYVDAGRTERNARCHGEHGKPIVQSVRWAIDMTTDLNVTGDELSKKTMNQKPQWRPSDFEETKINVDASFLDDTRSSATGLVWRDSSGTFIRGQALWYERVANPLVMEAQAVRDGSSDGNGERTSTCPY